MTDLQANTAADDLQGEMKDLASRDLQLWSIGLLVLFILAVGMMALILPNLMWNSAPIRVEVKLLPQLFSALIVLVFLFNLYLINQKRQLNAVRDTLVKRLLLNTAGSNSPIDALTNVLSRETVAGTLAREKSRADRQGSELAVAVVDIAGFRNLNRRFGNLAGDHALLVLAQILKATFRGSDTIARLGGDEFIVVMPDTNRSQGRCALQRLRGAVATWNESTSFQYKLSLNAGVASYLTGFDIHHVVAEATALACARKRIDLEGGIAQTWSRPAAMEAAHDPSVSS